MQNAVRELEVALQKYKKVGEEDLEENSKMF
jgi:hypothetical protein